VGEETRGEKGETWDTPQFSYKTTLVWLNLPHSMSLPQPFDATPYHLLRSFKKIVGLPLHAFMLNARIERAKQLLLYRVPLAAVAAETGFADQSHFHKAFRLILAAPPPPVSTMILYILFALIWLTRPGDPRDYLLIIAAKSFPEYRL
jgi:hypothetical protein